MTCTAHDMHEASVTKPAKALGIRSVPAVVVDGRLADCCAERGPTEASLRPSTPSAGFASPSGRGTRPHRGFAATGGRRAPIA
jgi:hypothetical protein